MKMSDKIEQLEKDVAFYEKEYKEATALAKSVQEKNETLVKENEALKNEHDSIAKAVLSLISIPEVNKELHDIAIEEAQKIMDDHENDYGRWKG